MTGNEFIFSSKLKHRIWRHIVFWTLYYLRFVALYLPDIKTNSLLNSDIYVGAFHEALNFLPIYLFTVYSAIYFVLPVYLAKKNRVFLISACLFLVIVSIFFGYIILTSDFNKNMEDQLVFDLYKGVGGCIAITGCAVIIKILKDYFFRQREYERLVAQSITNKLELLKLQIQPNILFECLNNICIDIDAGTIHAPGMILNLSELLSYLLYEGEMEQVTLEKEIKMLQTYIDLKEAGYKNKLKIDFRVIGDTDTFPIAPVLFLPLFETAILPFEKIVTTLFLRAEIKIVTGKLFFNLERDLPGIQMTEAFPLKTTLDSIKHRLQNSGRYKFKIESKNNVNNFSVSLQLEPLAYFKAGNTYNNNWLVDEYA